MFDFPNAPSVGQLYPATPVAGQPQYTWDGEKWVLSWYNPPVVSSAFPSGTVMLFYQAAAPTGWTKLTTQNDKALRVVSGNGGVAGGTNAFSTVMAQTVVGSTTLSSAQLPSHSHPPPSPQVDFVGDYSSGGGWAAPPVGSNMWAQGSTGNTGGGTGHNHPITMAIQYIDLILASMN